MPKQEQPTWKQIADKERATPKFVAKGRKLRIDPMVEPTEEMVEGKYGKRRMLIVESVEMGRVYVTPAKFCEIAANFNNDWESKVTVEF